MAEAAVADARSAQEGLAPGQLALQAEYLRMEGLQGLGFRVQE